MIKLWDVSINDKLDSDTLINIFQFCIEYLMDLGRIFILKC